MTEEDLRKVREAWERFEAENPQLKVASEKCHECLFTANRIVSEERMKEILAGCEREDRHFICHLSTLRNEDVVCRGFYENCPTTKIRLMEAMRRIELVDVATGKPCRQDTDQG